MSNLAVSSQLEEDLNTSNHIQVMFFSNAQKDQAHNQGGRGGGGGGGVKGCV